MQNHIYIEPIGPSVKSKLHWIVFWTNKKDILTRQYKIFQNKKESLKHANQLRKNIENEEISVLWFDRNDFKIENDTISPKIGLKLFGNSNYKQN